MKKVILSLLITTTLLSSSLMVSAEKVHSFKDVSKTHWGYNSIMAMTELGYFAGKGEIVNGVGVFAPNDTMTRAEFLTVVARIVIGEDNIYRHEGSEWWQDYYTALVDHRVIGITDFDDTKLNEPMTRAEMAFVAVKALEYMGEDFKGLPIYSIPNYIPDYNSIQPRYQQSVVKAYGKGILVGVDSKGTYDPNGVLERAAATTVLYRIIEKSQRADVDFKASSSSGPQVNASGLLAIDPDNGKAVPAELVNSDSLASITIYEGQNRSNRPAKAGDVYVKANGEHITITVDQYGIVGGGQGLQLDNGLNYNSVNGPVKAGNGLSFAYGGANLGGAHNGLYWVDSTGKNLRNGQYKVNYTTGEAHWVSEWQVLRENIPAPDYNGKTDGEVSNDVYKLYRWDSIMECWMNNY